MTAVTAFPSQDLKGRIRVPGDKSISHRALMFGALSIGETRISGLLEGEDVINTAKAMSAMGAKIERMADGEWVVNGVGVGGLLEPEAPLDMGNSGTGARLLMGLLSTHPLTATFIGDSSLSKRPMQRVIDPLSRFGATFTARDGDKLPLTLKGAGMPLAQSYRLPVASAQVKSAVLLAGLNTPGITTVIEPVPTRDHTERMLRGFGAEIHVVLNADGEREISLHGPAELKPQTVRVPADPSSAAFPILAGAVVPGSEITVEAVGMNGTRAGFFIALRQMGADLHISNEREEGGEPVADLTIKAGPLHGITLDPAIAPSMIDEFPALFVACAVASGRSVLTGLDELRVKESDRISAMAAALTAAGVTVEELPDGVIIEGTGGQIPGGGTVKTHLDHRIAMSSLILGMAAQASMTIDDAAAIHTSFPIFIDLMTGLGAKIGAAA